jgi:hypothetical protein
MTNRFDEMRVALREAEATLEAANNVSRQMASMLQGRMRYADSEVLKRLKRELRNFNMTTGEWKP